MKLVEAHIMILLVVMVFGSVTYSQNTGKVFATSNDVSSAVCILYPTEGNEVNGIITFTKIDDGIKIIADVKGLTPGRHGFHIHEFGDCSALDGKSAGGHFNPENKKHGAPGDEERHVGDLGNLIANDSGKVHYEAIDTYINLDGPNSILGRAIIVHYDEDDFITQPTGNAGGRVACGVIGISK